MSPIGGEMGDPRHRIFCPRLQIGCAPNISGLAWEVQLGACLSLELRMLPRHGRRMAGPSLPCVGQSACVQFVALLARRTAASCDGCNNLAICPFPFASKLMSMGLCRSRVGPNFPEIGQAAHHRRIDRGHAKTSLVQSVIRPADLVKQDKVHDMTDAREKGEARQVMAGP